MIRQAHGLAPIYSPTSKVLILGTIPSEASEAKGEYYATSTNKFWKTICGYLMEKVPGNYADKVKLLNDYGIAVWDLIETCEIEGSKNSTIRKPYFNDLQKLLSETNIELILLNGKDALEIFEREFKTVTVPYAMAPNTSNANATFSHFPWFAELSKVIK